MVRDDGAGSGPRGGDPSTADDGTSKPIEDDGTDNDAAGNTGQRDEISDETASRQGWAGGAFARFRRRSRRQQLLRLTTLVVVVVAVVLLAVVPIGILGLVVNDSATFAADPATPTQPTLSETGYEQTSAETVVVRRSISPAGQDRTIVVKNKRRSYTRTIEVQNRSFDTGVFVTLTSPSIKVAGNEQNPLAEMTDRELLNRFASELEAVNGELTFERVGEREAALVGQRVTVGEFRTTMTVDGEDRDFAVYVATARSEGDIVVVVGLHPTAFADERVSIMQLLYDVKHSVTTG